MADTRDVAITTIDNPYDPLDQFPQWFQFDIEKGYNTCSKLARICYTSDALSDEENKQEIERAIDTLIEIDFMKIYKKVKK